VEAESGIDEMSVRKLLPFLKDFIGQ
jgi:hypothetical protein